MNTQFYIRTVSREEKPVRIRMKLRDGKISLYGSTMEYVLPSNWDDKNHRLGSTPFKNKKEIAAVLEALRLDVEDSYHQDLKTGRVGKKWLQNIIDDYYRPPEVNNKELPMLQYIEKIFIGKAKTRPSKHGRPVDRKQLSEYNRTFHYLQSYIKKQKREIGWMQLDQEFYQGFVEYLEGTGMARNTAGRKVITLKAFMNFAAADGIEVNQAYKRGVFKPPQETVEKIYLTEKELDAIYRLDLSENEGLDKVRDWFILGAWIGQRFDDWHQVRQENIDGDYLRITQGKTGARVVIPLLPMTRAILEKYDYEMPKLVANQNFNIRAKEVCRRAGIDDPVHVTSTTGGTTRTVKKEKWELVASHTCRRSFASNLYLKNFPVPSLMKLTGHKSESAFLRYIRLSDDQHAKLLKDRWEEITTGQLKVV